jgi:hypothetical protein
MKWIIVLSCWTLCSALNVHGDNDPKPQATLHWWISDSGPVTAACGGSGAQANEWRTVLDGLVTVHLPQLPVLPDNDDTQQTMRRVQAGMWCRWMSDKKCRQFQGKSLPELDQESLGVNKTNNSTDTINNNSTETVPVSGGADGGGGGGGGAGGDRRLRRRSLGTKAPAPSTCATATRSAHTLVQNAARMSASCRDYILHHASEWECRSN